MPGPPPKRSTHRRRRNAGPPVDTATSDGEVRGPALVGRHSAIGVRWYEALRRSGQSQFFEPSDWAVAELVVTAIDAFSRSPSAVMLASINTAMTNLLATEGDRRRLRLELEKPAPAAPTGATDPVALLDEYRTRAG